MNSEDVSKAIILYTGRGLVNHPVRDPQRLTDHFPAAEAEDLLLRVEELESEFYLTNPRPEESLVESANRAAAVFRYHHPEILNDAINALRWAYAWDWK